MLCLIPMVNMAQEAQVSENDAVESAETVHREIGMRMMQYIDELHELAIVSDMHVTFMESSPLTMTYVNVLKEKVSILDERYNSIDVRWKTFMQAMQMDIADNEELMTTMSNVEQLKQILADSIAAKKQQCNALQDFVQAEELLAGQDTVFKSLYHKAFKLSLVKKLSPQLEKLKIGSHTARNENAEGGQTSEQ